MKKFAERLCTLLGGIIGIVAVFILWGFLSIAYWSTKTRINGGAQR